MQACKNVVLAGIGSVTLLDDRPVCQESISAIFLIPAEAQVAVPPPRLSSVCAEALRDFNPMVAIHVAEGEWCPECRSPCFAQNPHIRYHHVFVIAYSMLHVRHYSILSYCIVWFKHRVGGGGFLSVTLFVGLI